MSGKRVELTIVGAGRLARSLAGALSSRRNARVVIASRKASAARRIAAGRPRVTPASLSDAVPKAGVILLAVPDAAIAAAARALVPMRRSWRGVVVLHAAGALGPDPLAVLARAGAATGVFHPLAALGSAGSGALAGAAARIEGSARARTAARSVAVAAGLRPLRTGRFDSDASRAAYHAAASLAANDLVALLDAGQRLLSRHGVSPSEARRALARLARGVAEQFETGGTRGPLTGPASRGDAATVARHLRAIAAVDPDVVLAHRALSRRLAALAVGEGRLEPKDSRGLARALSRGRGPGRTV